MSWTPTSGEDIPLDYYADQARSVSTLSGIRIPPELSRLVGANKIIVVGNPSIGWVQDTLDIMAKMPTADLANLLQTSSGGLTLAGSWNDLLGTPPAEAVNEGVAFKHIGGWTAKSHKSWVVETKLDGVTTPTYTGVHERYHGLKFKVQDIPVNFSIASLRDLHTLSNNVLLAPLGSRYRAELLYLKNDREAYAELNAIQAALKAGKLTLLSQPWGDNGGTVKDLLESLPNAYGTVAGTDNFLRRPLILPDVVDSTLAVLMQGGISSAAHAMADLLHSPDTRVGISNGPTLDPGTAPTEDALLAAVSTVGDQSLLTYKIPGGPEVALPAPSAVIPLTNPTTGKTAWATLYWKNPETGELNPFANAVGAPSTSDGIGTFDNNGDGVVNDYDASWWESPVTLNDGTKTTLRALNVKSVKLNPDGSAAFEMSDNSTTDTLPQAPSGPDVTECVYLEAFFPQDLYLADSDGNYLPLTDFGMSAQRGVNGLVLMLPDGSVLPVATAGELSEAVAGAVVAMFEDGPIRRISEALELARQAVSQMRYDPLAIDLDGNGVQLTSLSGGIQFDLEDTGHPHQTSWISAGDGFLVYDPNGDPITNGSQLFGQNTLMPNGQLASSGFEALFALANADSIANGAITNSDPLFAQIRVLKGDGSLLTLEQAGIAAINLRNNQVDLFDQYGNQILDTGSFVRTDGSTAALSDVALLHETSAATQVDVLTETEEVAALPDMVGAGMIASLHQAMLHDATGTLQAKVAEFASSSTDPILYDSLVDQILYQWTGATSASASSYGQYVDPQHADVIFKFLGRAPQFIGERPAPYIEIAYDKMKESAWAMLMAQTHLKDEFEKVMVTSDGFSVSYDLSQLTQSIRAQIDADATAGTAALKNVYRALFGLDLTRAYNYADFYAEFAGDPDLKAAMDSSRPHLSPNSLDILSFGLGDGHKEINEYGASDIVVLGSSLTPNDVYFHYEGDGNSFQLRIKNSDDILTIQRPADFHRDVSSGDSDFLPNSRFQFADGTLMTREQIEAAFATYAAGNQDVDHSTTHGVNETIYANGNDEVWASRDKNSQSTIKGGAGAEILHAGDGFSTVIGGTGDQTIYGGAGTSILKAAIGNTTFYTGSGDTTFVFNPGDGQATIHESSTSNGSKNDRLQLGTALADVEFYREGDNLRVILASNDELLIEGQFDPERVGRTINTFEFADGSFLSLGELQQSYLRLAVPNENVAFVSPDENYILDVPDGKTIFVGDADDVITSVGNSQIHLGAGHNIVEAGAGVSTISGGSGGNTFVFNLGDGQQTVSLNGGFDAISFGEGISSSDVVYSVVGTDLHVTIEGQPDSEIIVKGQLSGEDARVLEAFNFFGGSSVSWSDLQQQLTIEADPDAITDRTSSLQNELIAVGGSTQTVLLGSGNNTVEIGGGNVVVESGAGNNTFVVTDKSASIVLEQASGGSYNGNDDKLVLGHGIDLRDLSFARNGDDLVISFVGALGTISLAGVFGADTVKRIESVEFADGTKLSFNEIAGSVAQAASYENAESAGASAQTFEYSRGDGTLAISEDVSASGVSDTINFGAGISARDLVLLRQGANLQISVLGNVSDNIVVLNQFSNDKRVETFHFADNSSFSFEQLLSNGLYVAADVSGNVYNQSSDDQGDFIRVTGANAQLTTGSGDNVIVATGGGASIELGGGHNFVTASGGGNTAHGGSGVDTISLGAGTNTIFAGTGSETFVFNNGDGQLTVFESAAPQVGASDVIAFGEGIEAADLELSSQGTDLTIKHAGSSDQIDLTNALLAGTSKRVHLFSFADGTRISYKDLLQLGVSVAIGTAGNIDRSFSVANEIVSITADGVEFHAGSGNDTIAADSDNAKIYTGSGSADVQTTGDGTNVYLGSGDAIVTVSTGVETIHAGSGFNEIRVLAGGGIHHIDESNANKQFAGSDSIVFGEGFALDDLQLTQGGQTGADLQISFVGLNDRIVIEGVFGTAASSPISFFEFANGDFVTLEELLDRGVDVDASVDYAVINNSTVEWNQNLTISGDHDQVYLGKGHNNVLVTGQADTIYGGVDNTVELGSGNAYYVGSGHSEISVDGNDDIYGGAGSYSIKLEIGSGDNVVHEASIGGPSTDTVVLGEGVQVSDVHLSSHGTDLTLSLDDGSSLQLNDQLTKSGIKHVTRYELSNGSLMSQSAFEHSSLVELVLGDATNIDRRFSNLHEHLVVNQASSTVYLGSGNDVIDIAGDNAYIELGTGNSQFTVSANQGTVQSVRDSGDADINVEASVSSFTLYGVNQNGGTGIHGTDTLRIDGDLADIELSAENWDLRLTNSVTGQQITVKNGLLAEIKPVKFAFAGEEAITLAELSAQKPVVLPTMNGDFQTTDRTGSTVNEQIVINGAHDIFRAGTGHDRIDANGNYDEIYLKSGGADIVASGNHDFLQLGTGSSNVIINGDYTTVEAGDSNTASGAVNIEVSGDHTLIRSFRGSGDMQLVIDSSADDTTVFEGIQSASIAYGSDTIVLNSLRSNLKFSAGEYTQQDLIVTDTNTGQQLKLANLLQQALFKPINIEFSNGETAALSSLLSVRGAITLETSGSAYQTIRSIADTFNTTIHSTGYLNTIRTESADDIVIADGDNATVVDGGGSSEITVNGAYGRVQSGAGTDIVNVGANASNFTLVEGAADASSQDRLNVAHTLDETTLGSEGRDLEVKFSNGQSAYLVNELNSTSNHLQFFGFSDGTVLTRQQLLARGITINVTSNFANVDRSFSEANETINVTGMQSTVTTGSGNDTVNLLGVNDGAVVNGDDVVHVSGAGARVYTYGPNNIVDSTRTDTIYQLQDGSATIHGAGTFNIGSGRGDITFTGDSLVRAGSAQSSTYIFGEGAGNDVIDTDFANNTHSDKVVFARGINWWDLTASIVNGFDLQLQVLGSPNDQLRIRYEMLDGSQKRVDEFRFANGQSYSRDGLVQKLQSNDAIEITSTVDNDVIDLHLTARDATVTASGNNDLLIAGGGTTTFVTSGDDTNIIAGSGAELITTTGARTSITGSSGALQVTASGADLQLTAGSGDATINSSGANANITLEDGMAFIVSTGNDALITAGTGTASITTAGARTTIAGGSGVLTVIADGDDDVITTGAGVCDITASGDRTSVTTGSGSVAISLSGSSNNIVIGSGDATVSATGSNNVITLGSGIANVDVSGSGNTITAGSGSSTVELAAGDNIIFGGSGMSTFVFGDAAGSATINENTAAAVPGTTDVIAFGTGITSGDIALTSWGYDLTLNVHDLHVNVADELNPAALKAINSFTFVDGVTLTLNQLLVRGVTVNDVWDNTTADRRFSSIDETINAYGNGDIVYAGSGNDTINAYGMSVTVYGGTGNNVINMSGNNDTAIAGTQATAISASGNYANITGSSANDAITLSGANGTADGGSGDDSMIAFGLNDTVYGGDGNDTLTATGTNDSLYGGNGNDALSGGVGAYLSGGSGDDTYSFSQGCGGNIVAESSPFGAGGGNDTIRLGAGITSSQISISDSGSDLVLDLGGQDRITVQGQFGSDATAGIEQIVLADGTQIAFAYGTNQGDTIKAPAGTNQVIVGLDGNDKLYGNDGDNYLLGGLGDDSLYGGYGNDHLSGGAGNDYLAGGRANDTLNGGTGDDTVHGDSGNDTFVQNLGDGSDNISDRGGFDMLRFGGNVQQSHVAFFMEHNNLQIAYSDNNSDLITIKNQGTKNGEIERFQLSDNSYLTSGDINLIIQEMSSYAITNGVSFATINDVKTNADLMNIVASSWKKDA